MNYQELGVIINRLPKNDKQVLLPLRITNVDDKNATVSFSAINQYSINLQYRLNGQSTYQNWDHSAVELQPGDYVEFIGLNDVAFATSTDMFSKFNISNGNVELSGNIQSLIVGENLNPDPVDLVNPLQFGGLFLGNETIINAHKLMLPARSLTYGCYAGMFGNCTSLTTPPELPATTLANSCYFGMFNVCTSLETAPELPATTLVEECYKNMFNGCIKLKSIKVSFVEWSSGDYTLSWMFGVSGQGTFTCPSSLPEQRGEDYIPDGWDVVYE